MKVLKILKFYYILTKVAMFIFKQSYLKILVIIYFKILVHPIVIITHLMLGQ